MVLDLAMEMYKAFTAQPAVVVGSDGMILVPKEWIGIPAELAQSHGFVYKDYLLNRTFLTKAGSDKIAEIRQREADASKAQSQALIQGWCV
jgi:hypothetical protein